MGAWHDPYTGYVAVAYGVSAIILLGLILGTWRTHCRAVKEMDEQERTSK